MAITATSQTLVDGDKTIIMKFTAIMGATENESAVTKVDVSALSDTPSRVKIMRMWYNTDGLSVNLLWDATANVLAHTIGNTDSGYLDFRSFGGITNNAGAGITGDLLFTTLGGSAGDSYTITLELSKS